MDEARERSSGDAAGNAANPEPRPGGDVDERAASLDARESDMATREAAHQDRRQRAHRQLADAADRDEAADDRDRSADSRDMAANLAAFIRDDDKSGAAHEGRQAAATDRKASKADRASSAVDRGKLTNAPDDS
jgi:hypothetical protein